jgi:hypothetical protein
MLEVPDDLFPFLTCDRLWLIGNFLRGGTAHVLLDPEAVSPTKVTTKLGPMTFGVAAVLVLKNFQSGGQPSGGFVDAMSLQQELHKWRRRERERTQHRTWRDDQGTGLDNRVAKHVFKLRQALAHRKGRDWAHRFVESGALGYRISTQPQWLYLEIVGDRQYTFDSWNGVADGPQV